jgi:hypothetical protein
MEMLPTEDQAGDFWAETYLPFFRALKQGSFVEPSYTQFLPHQARRR